MRSNAFDDPHNQPFATFEHISQSTIGLQRGSARIRVQSMAYQVVQPYTARADRLKTATVVRSFDTIDAAAAHLEWTARRLRNQGTATDVIELVIVDERHERVKLGH